MLDVQKFIWAPKVVVSEIDERTTKFELQHVPRWFWHTLGNALRRLILSYNVGGSITGLKIKWVPHEYFVIDGVRESVMDIILNFKTLRFKVDENIEKNFWVSQRFSWVAKYTSDSLKLPSGVELMDSGDVYLFEIADPSLEVNFEFRVEKWYGYMTIDSLRTREKENEDWWDVGLLLIDNDFKMVDYVKYEVDEVIEDFSGGVKDALILEVKSKYTKISPKEMLMFAWEVLASYAKLFVFDDIYIDKSVFIEQEDIEEKERFLEETKIKTMPIDALPLSERTRNALIKNQILYVEDLEKKKKGELLLMKWVGRKAIEEINKALANIWKSLIT